jgi:murein DD-endopeptidase MepM/ murein hydrolase activator NlpD
MSLAGVARSAEGLPIDATAAAAVAESSFTVMPKPKPTPKPASTRAQATRVATGLRWASPLRGPITQYFGQHLTRYGIHRGIDIDGNTGDPVRAAATGTVIAAGWVDACSGIAVGLDHGRGLSSWYRHLSRVGVRVGQRVSVGSIIGRVGNTGCSLGSHLHFAIRRGDTYLNPLSYVSRW